MNRMNRRRLFKLAAQSGMVAAAGMTGKSLVGSSTARADAPAPRYLIVLAATGGASITDSFLALSRDEVAAAGGNPDTLSCFSDSQLVAVDGTPFRAVDLEHSLPALNNYAIKTSQSRFVKKHAASCLVVAQEVSSVNHGTAETRSITGAGAWRGRTLQECVAEVYGENLIVPNLNMGSGGFTYASGDTTLPAWAAPTTVVDPRLWAYGLGAKQGVSHGVGSSIFDAARKLRDGGLEANGAFMAERGAHASVQRWIAQRGAAADTFEPARLFEKATFLGRRQAGLESDAEIDKLIAAFPDFEADELEAQAILCYLAITRGIACSVTIGPSFAASAESLSKIRNPPLAFDFSHQDHRGAQAMMWDRLISVADRLITLLAAAQVAGADESYWDRTLLYVATDFGRDKVRPSGADVFSTGHHLNNGSLIVSPLVKGNRVLGGVDAKTGLTHGFDLKTGAPERDARPCGEREIFAGILQALDVDASDAGLPVVSAISGGVS